MTSKIDNDEYPSVKSIFHKQLLLQSSDYAINDMQQKILGEAQ